MTISWRAKLTFVAGVALIVTGLMLAFAGPGASGATAPLPVGSSPTQHPTGPASQSSTPSPTLTGSQAPVTTSPTPAANQDPTGTKGDNGTVKIHNPSTAVTDRRNEPHVSCGFYLDAFGFDPNESVTWWITAWAPTGDRATTVANGTIILDSSGNGFTEPIKLGPGHYKLFWTFDPEHGTAKQKVFWVVSTCASDGTTDASAPDDSPTAPASSSKDAAPLSHGGLPITGWPLAVLVVGAAALLGTGTAAIVVARRRRSLQSSR